MDTVEHRNWRQIEALNQRGGRTLSIVDLLLAGTIDAETAGHVGEAIQRGASFLTAANPGGAGKTALLAALLGFLPEGVPVVTVDHPDAIAADGRADEQRCYLAHEIGSGHWYGYIWGPVVGRYLDLAADGHMVASCLHADTIEEVHDTLHACTLGDPGEALRGIEFILFMHVDRSSGGIRRRVASVYRKDGMGRTHDPVSQWDPATDSFEQLTASSNARAQELAGFLTQLAERGVREYGSVRSAYLDYIRSAKHD